MTVRVLAGVTLALALAVGGLSARAATVEASPTAVGTRATPAPAARAEIESLDDDVTEAVLGFGDRLEELHLALSFDRATRDEAAVRGACRRVLAGYPALRGVLGNDGTDLLAAAESLVDSCRRGFAVSLDDAGFAVIDGDYFTYRELSLGATS